MIHSENANSMQCIVWSMAHAELPGRPNHCSLDLHWGGTWGVGCFFFIQWFSWRVFDFLGFWGYPYATKIAIIFPIILWSSDPYSNWELRIESYELRETRFHGENFRVPQISMGFSSLWKKTHQNGDLEGVYIYIIYDICVSYGIVGF